MSERRMFAKAIVNSDAFLDMPLSTQCLYFHLGMVADDDGFVNNPKSIMRSLGAAEEDLDMLKMKKFILAFDSGVIVIKHWRIHNYIRKDRKCDTKYVDEMESLLIDENGAYTTKKAKTDGCQSFDSHLTVTCPSNVSIGKDSIGKVSIGKNSIGKNSNHRSYDDDEEIEIDEEI